MTIRYLKVITLTGYIDNDVLRAFDPISAKH